MNDSHLFKELQNKEIDDIEDNLDLMREWFEKINPHKRINQLVEDEDFKEKYSKS